MIQWFHIGVSLHDVDRWFRCGPWMFAPRHGGDHRVEYNWIMELRCNCKIYEAPPTPKD